MAAPELPGTPPTPEGFFAGHPLGLAVCERVVGALATVEGVGVRTSKSQVAFRRRRGFAWLWLPGTYLAKPAAEVVLSIALGRQDASARFKQVAHPARAHWIHHLEVHAADDIDDDIATLLREAAERAGG